MDADHDDEMQLVTQTTVLTAELYHHPLEHPSLRQGAKTNPKYRYGPTHTECADLMAEGAVCTGRMHCRCPLCDKRIYPPKSKWTDVLKHYTDVHLAKTVRVGKYTCFPCGLVSQSARKPSKARGTLLISSLPLCCMWLPSGRPQRLPIRRHPPAAQEGRGRQAHQGHTAAISSR